MDLFDTLRQRYSVREYDTRAEVSEGEVRQLLEAAVEAPSAGNCQPWHFVVVRDDAARRGLSEAAYGQAFLTEAPVVIAVCAVAARSAGRYGARGVSLYCLQDTAAATEHILLAATAMGLGTCWVGAFDEAAAAGALALTDDLRPVALISVGHPAAPSSRHTTRLSLDEVVSYK